ncbi:MAG: aconitate hydratase AcnA [Planctomycetota bacterium]
MKDSFRSCSILSVSNKEYEIHRLDALRKSFDLSRLPFTHKILLENLLRCEDGISVTRDDIEALASWDPKEEPNREIAFRPSRVLLQDFTGVPAVVDLAAMRDAMHRMGGDPALINPLQPVELVIDHSVQVDAFGHAGAFAQNAALEAERNRERYTFLRWGQSAFSNFKVVPPDTGIVHQVNLEYLARVIFDVEAGGRRRAYPDTLVGTDSHTTMINGLGVLGWGVGGIEAEAAMLGQPVSMLIPQVVGFRLTGRLAEGATATDLVLTITEMLRKKGVVGRFVEFYGPGLDALPLADRATIANMSPEYGATCGIFPIDKETLRYLELSGRSAEQVALTEAYAREQGLFRDSASPEAEYTDTLSLDLGEVESCLAGPLRPQDRITLRTAKDSFEKSLVSSMKRSDRSQAGNERSDAPGLRHGSVVIAAITSCTNTSNPAVMLGAGLLARKACEKGLKVPAWVKTSLAPGSRVVTEYLTRAGVLPHLETLGFHLVGYGCTTCIGNSGPLPAFVSKAIADDDLYVCSVLSGNRNFEGRIHPEVRMNYLASPLLVVVYALAGRMDIDLFNEPLGRDANGNPVYMKDIWPAQKEISDAVAASIGSALFLEKYADLYAGDAIWNNLEVKETERYEWDVDSTYVKEPPFFLDMDIEPPPVEEIIGARALAFLGDSITTDHISPAGAIKADSPAGTYLRKHGIEPAAFNSYGSRRGNHEVMMRGTFANVRLRNKLAPGTEGGWTTLQPGGEKTSIFNAAMHYMGAKVPVIIVAGKEYGSGSSRDWAAKGPRLLGVRAVIAESFERIHRSNLIGMGIIPLQFVKGENAESLGLNGTEIYDIKEVADLEKGMVQVTATPHNSGAPICFKALKRIDTPQEKQYFLHGGILQYVLRKMMKPDQQ